MLTKQFTTVFKRSFQKKSATQFVKTARKDIPANAALLIESNTTPVRWTPTHGNSFRSFAEYRLRVTNQSPLAKASK